MNDSELGTMVRQSVAEIHSATPVAQIISRGRAVRARRRIPGVAGALAMTAATALAVTALLTPGHSGLLASGHPRTSHPGTQPSGRLGSHPASARLAAWTVAMQANGDIDITINQLKDPAGLQATLRADGLPATVSFSGTLLSPSCQGYLASTSTLDAVFQGHSTYIAIDPSALPSGTGVAISDEPGAGLPTPSGNIPSFGRTPTVRPSVPPLSTAIDGPLAIGLVYASPQCTG
jgi:hypothetical protein